MSPDEFDKLKRLVQIFIVTAVPVEHKAVQEKLTPIDKDIITIYGNYEFGFFGKFLVAHQCVEAGSLKAATAITSMLTEFGISSSSKKNFYVIMPGIACGLQRSKDDQTTIPISELAKYLDPKNPLPDHLLLPDHLKKLLEEVLKPYNDKFKEDPNITIPLFLTPERQHQKPPSNQFVGDILLATSIEQHSYEATKANKIENRTQKYMPSKERLKLIQAKIPHWQTTPDATIETRLYQVHPGLIISGDHLVNNFSKRQSFISHNNDAIGLEMEGAALGASIDHFSNLETSPKAFFIFAKSICDWGVGKSDLWQKKAASTSVSFLHFCLDDPFFFGKSVKFIDPFKISNIFSKSLTSSSSKKNINSLLKPTIENF
jgi:nucleoside phosphorylase